MSLLLNATSIGNVLPCHLGRPSRVKQMSHLDVRDGVLQLWPHDVIEGINSPIGGFDGLIQGQKCCLKTCQLNKQLYRRYERLQAVVSCLLNSFCSGLDKVGFKC